MGGVSAEWAKNGTDGTNRTDRNEKETDMRSLVRLVMALFCAGVFVGVSRGAELADGTLLFLENCSSVVERSTRGEIGHVALVFQDGGERYVYEATPAKVRRVTLASYLEDLARQNQRQDDEDQVRAFALAPKLAYSSNETARMRAYLDAQVGRRYSVKNYVRGKPYDGIHCAELASNTLNASGRYAFADCHRINPQTLYVGVARTHVRAERVVIPALEVQEPLSLRAGRRWGRWLTWCGWSWREAWLWLW